MSLSVCSISCPLPGAGSCPEDTAVKRKSVFSIVWSVSLKSWNDGRSRSTSQEAGRQTEKRKSATRK